MLGFDLLIIVQVKIFQRQEGSFGIPPPSSDSEPKTELGAGNSPRTKMGAGAVVFWL